MGSRTATSAAAQAWPMPWAARASRDICRRGRVWGDRHRLHQWGQFARRAPAGWRGQPARQGAHPGRQPPTFPRARRPPSPSGHRFSRRTDAAGIFRRPGGQALNTVNCDVMVNPSCVPGEHELFICGNDAGAKRRSRGVAQRMVCWKPGSIIELGIFPTRVGRRCSRGLQADVGPVGDPAFQHPYCAGSVNAAVLILADSASAGDTPTAQWGNLNLQTAPHRS